MKPFIVLIGILLFVNACNEKISKQNEDIDTTCTTYFYKHLTGTIDGKDACMDINISNDTILSGEVYINDCPFPLSINGTWNAQLLNAYIDSSNDNRFYDREVEDVEQDIMLGTWHGKTWVGTFAGKKCIMKESYEEGAYTFSYRYKDDSTIDPKSKSTIAYHKMSMPMISDKSKQQWFNQQLYLLMGDTAFKGSVQQFIEKHSRTEIPSDSDELSYMISLPHSSEHMYEILYNKNNKVCVCMHIYAYYGGAHGVYGLVYLNLDVSKKQMITLKDVLTTEQLTKLPNVVSDLFRKKYLQDGEPITDICYDENPELVNDNYMITEKGINFWYNPYEIAGYAQGLFSVYVPFEALKN